LIELSLSLTDTEKMYIFSNGKDLSKYLEKMSEKQGVIANAAFASILKRLLCMGKEHLCGVVKKARNENSSSTNIVLEPIRDQSFDLENYNALREDMVKFLF
jgi:hypothetical protein